jgi:hypothetical protein
MLTLQPAAAGQAGVFVGSPLAGDYDTAAEDLLLGEYRNYYYENHGQPVPLSCALRMTTDNGWSCVRLRDQPEPPEMLSLLRDGRTVLVRKGTPRPTTATTDWHAAP